MKKHIANLMTVFRIAGSLCLLFFPVFSPQFYSLYLLCGITDMTDGLIARKTNSVTPFGSLLDSVADFIFAVAAAIRLLPSLQLPDWIWIWIVMILMLKIIAMISGFLLYKRLIVQHTLMNKITGFLLFIMPLTLSFLKPCNSAVVLCSIASYAAIQEGYHIRTGGISCSGN